MSRKVDWKKVFIILIAYVIVFALVFHFTVQSKDDVNVSFPQSPYTLGEKKEARKEYLKVSNDGKRYHDKDGEWKNVDDIKK